MNRKVLLVVTCLSLLALLVACQSTEPANDGVKLNINPIYKNGKLVVEIETDLPNETRAVLTIVSDENEYFAQDELSISGQKTSSNEFSVNGKDLPKGNYNISLIIPVTEVQPESVQEIVGENFKNIKSEHTSDLGGYIILENNETFIID